jgi:hypothetical protein
MPIGQVVLLILLFGIGGVLILATINEARLGSVALLGFVSVVGLVLCRSTQARLNDPSLRLLGYLWLIKLGITLFLLYAGWMPQLDPATSTVWGYDPQRYYVQAQELIDNNWIPDFVSLSYVGILYYYGAMFYALGHNPVVPALVNSFITLLASLYLVKVGYEIKVPRGRRDWTLALALLLPEVLWFDVMTSRETLVAAALIFAMLTIGRYLASVGGAIALVRVVVASGISVLTIAAVRPSMLLPVIIAIVLLGVLVRPQRCSRVFQRTILISAAAATFILAPAMTAYLGGDKFIPGNLIRTAMSAQENVALSGDVEWSDHSIGMLLMPEGLLDSFFFLAPRMVLYVIAPLPKVLFPITDILEGSWAAWQHLFTLLSAIINVLAIPYVVGSLVQSIKTRKENAAPLVFHIAFWLTFMAIAGGNLIIHERYRVMASLLLWSCAWLGATTCSRSLIVNTSAVWYGMLTLGALFVVSYKIL